MCRTQSNHLDKSCISTVLNLQGRNGRSFCSAMMAEANRMSPVARFLVVAAFSGVLVWPTNTVEAEKVRGVGDHSRFNT